MERAPGSCSALKVLITPTDSAEFRRNPDSGEQLPLEQKLTPIIKEALAAAGRPQTCFNGMDGVRAIFDSQGLDLNEKMAIERLVLTALDKARAQGRIPLDLQPVIYFRRSGNTPEINRPVSASTKPKSGPFGVRFARRPIPGVKHIVLVASGKGGVGKSTVSANLAVALAKDHRVGLLDADVYGPSAQILLGLNGSMPVTSGSKLIPLEGHGVKVVSFGFLTDPAQPVIWRGPMVSKALEQFFYDVDWGELDYLIVDMPPGTGDVQMTFAERLPVAGAVIVTTPQDVALVDAHKALSMFEKLAVPVLGAVENMAWFTCPGCGHEEHIFGHDAFQDFLKSRELKLLARIPLRKEIRIRCDEGMPAARSSDGESKLPWNALAASIHAALPLGDGPLVPQHSG